MIKIYIIFLIISLLEILATIIHIITNMNTGITYAVIPNIPNKNDDNAFPKLPINENVLSSNISITTNPAINLMSLYN